MERRLIDMVKKWIEMTNDEVLKQYKSFQEVFGKNSLKEYFFFMTYASEDFKVKEGIIYRKL